MTKLNYGGISLLGLKIHRDRYERSEKKIQLVFYSQFFHIDVLRIKNMTSPRGQLKL